MIDLERVMAQALEAGFTHVSPLDVSTIRLQPEVRDMCASNSCGHYGKCWSCPPGCGTLEQLQQRLGGYTRGILVQTVAQLDAPFDYETMMDTEAAHKEHLLQLQQILMAENPRLLAIGAGRCKLCSRCTYPDAPCRFPEKQIASMEAYGMMVMEVCRDNGMTYYYGPNTLAYTGCFLLE